ncbi:MAG: cytoplasmic protein [Zetaproteobacteria bacterium]|nr:cytoplasmic protein [Pseudobdellovibrionaceae bacterium]
MEIPYKMLKNETLNEVIKDYIFREGTDYGHKEWTLDEKIQQVLTQIKSGKAKIIFDPKSSSCTIIDFKNRKSFVKIL